MIITWPILLYLWLKERRKNKESKDEAFDAASFGLYNPTYSFSTVDGFKDKLSAIREKQKEMVRNKTACIFPKDFTMNGNLKEGARVVNDWVKLMLMAFNGECDTIIDHVKYTNLEASQEKIRKNAETLNTIGKSMKIRLSEKYYRLKIDELNLAFSYQAFKEEEKERLRQIREEEREKAKLEKELEERRQKIYKDQMQISREIQVLTNRLKNASPAQQTDINNRINELNQHNDQLINDLQKVEERVQQARAGYVYIISNIGSFGENVYKIGMTRRLDPQDRVDELGDASVPFRFDVHAFIFSEDAVSLETALHHEFDKKRVNLINNRREFFHVSLDEIEDCVRRNYNRTAEFTRTAEAQEYRQSEEIRRSGFRNYAAGTDNRMTVIRQEKPEPVLTNPVQQEMPGKRQEECQVAVRQGISRQQQDVRENLSQPKISENRRNVSKNPSQQEMPETIGDTQRTTPRRRRQQ